MGADNIIEAEIVIPSGDVLIANACQNDDLFWAIRGGGGGTFGVITSLTVKAYPMPYVAVWSPSIHAANGTTPEAWWDFVARFHGLLPAAQAQGLQGYWTMGSSPTWTLTGALFIYNAANDTVKQIQAPLEMLLSESNDTITYTTTSLWSPSWYELLSLLLIPGSGGLSRGITASRLLTSHAVENHTLFARTLEEIGTKSAALTVRSPLYPTLEQCRGGLIRTNAARCSSDISVRHPDRKQDSG